MPTVELGGSPKDGHNSVGTSTDLSSTDDTRTLGAFNTGKGAGAYGESAQGDGLSGYATSPGKSGVVGLHSGTGNGVFGRSANGDGTVGVASAEGRSGVVGLHGGAGNGVFGRSDRGNGAVGVASARGQSGVVGIHGGNGNGIFGRAASPGYAGWFDGNVRVDGDIELINADCAEDFDVASDSEIIPGTVMVLDDDGALHESRRAYDRRVAGVVSGAGDFAPAIVLDRQRRSEGRVPIALIGKTYCRVDATHGPIAVGDLLTTAPTPGCAMKANDPMQAFGSVIGKALRPLASGEGLIPILVCLQ